MGLPSSIMAASMSNPIKTFRAEFAERSEENLYSRDGFVPIGKGLIFGLEHVLAMFFANLIPVMVVMANSGGDPEILDNCLRSCTFFAALATILELIPAWRFRSKLPLFMGSSYTFIGALSIVGYHYGLQTMFLSLIIAGGIATLLALFTPLWKRFVKTISIGVCVLAVGLSLIPVGIGQFLSTSADIPGLFVDGVYQFSVAWPYLLVAVLTLLIYLGFEIFGKGIWKHLAILFALLGGYLISLCFIPYNNMVDFSAMTFKSVSDFIDSPKPIFMLLPFSAADVNFGAILSILVIYIVYLVESMSGVENLTASVFDRQATSGEVTGCLTVSAFSSAIGAMFGASPLTPYNQNVSIVAQTKVKNHRALLFGAGILVVASFLPPISKALQTIPTAVLGGALLCLFASIAVSGMKIISSVGFTPKNILVLSLSLGIGYGITLASDFLTLSQDDNWVNYLKLVLSNPVAMMFIISMITSWAIPEKMNKEKTE